MTYNFEKFVRETEYIFETAQRFRRRYVDHKTTYDGINTISDIALKTKSMIRYNLITDGKGYPEYSFLNTNEHLYDNLIFICFGGSYAYGTNVEGSDIDIRGCALNTPADILLPKNNKYFEQYEDDNTDTVIYGFNKLMQLLSNCNPNTIELLGLDDDQYIMMTNIGRELLDIASAFLSRRAVHSFGGYASQQLYRLNQLCARKIPQPNMEEHILKSVKNAEVQVKRDVKYYDEDNLRLYIDKSDKEDMETEIFLDCNFSHYPLRDYCSIYNTLKNVTSEYGRIGKRNKRAEIHGKISKHAMHLVRLYYMCFDILEKREINTCRHKEHDLLMSIRNGEYSNEDGTMTSEFFELVDELEKRFEYAKENTDLPDDPDYETINDFIMDINKRVVSGNV